MSRELLLGTCIPCSGGSHEECVNTQPKRLMGCACCPERQVPLDADPKSESARSDLQAFADMLEEEETA